MLRKWSCVLCGDTLVEGQRFFFVPGKGYAHVECVYERLEPSRDVVALMDANEVLLYSIVRLKEAARIAETSEARDAIVRVRRRIEDMAEELERLLLEKGGLVEAGGD